MVRIDSFFLLDKPWFVKPNRTKLFSNKVALSFTPPKKKTNSMSSSKAHRPQACAQLTVQVATHLRHWKVQNPQRWDHWLHPCSSPSHFSRCADRVQSHSGMRLRRVHQRAAAWWRSTFCVHETHQPENTSNKICQFHNNSSCRTLQVKKNLKSRCGIFCFVPGDLWCAK